MPENSTGNAARDVYVCTDIVVAFKNATSGEWNPPTSTIVFELVASGIPRMILTLDPKHTEGDDVNIAVAPTLGDFSAWLNKAQAYAIDPSSTADIKIKLVNQSNGHDQSLDLKDWIVVAAGMTGVSASGGFALEVEIQHPVGKLDRSFATIGNRIANPLWGSANYTDPIVGFGLALAAWAEVKPVSPAAVNPTCVPTALDAVSLEIAFQKAWEAMKEKVKEVPKYLEWRSYWPDNNPDYSDLPCVKGCLSVQEPLVKYSLTAYANDAAESSIWSILTQVLFPEFQLALVPTFWDEKLQVIPYTPWAKPSITIYDDEIADINLPGVDGAPIGGARVLLSPAQSAMDTTYFQNNQAAESQKLATEILYLPKAVITASKDKLIGRIITERLPGWFLGVMAYDAAAAGETTSPTERAGDSAFTADSEGMDTTGEGEPPPVVTGGFTDEIQAEYIGAAYLIAYQFFLAQYRAQLEASFMTCLLLKARGSGWQDNYVVPGCVVRVQTRPDPQDGSRIVLFHMYVTKITHVISAGQSEASTTWQGTYCRPELGVLDIVKSGTYNPMYL